MGYARTGRKQRGMSFWGVITMVVGIAFVAVIGMKLIPAYIEYGKIRQAIASIKSKSDLSTEEDIRKAFYNAMTIDDIKSVTEKDLVIKQRADGSPLIYVEYQVVVPLIGNVSALLDFVASSDGSVVAAAEANEGASRESSGP
ncbi:MAG: DUF4845 domain-containing protein [Methylophilaceae bacterium]|nr:DUF4845 domain-containing protein [Methylophilaceae bacterium]